MLGPILADVGFIVGRSSKGPNLRLKITLSDAADKVLREISELTGEPMAGLVSELVDEAAPVLAAQVRVLRELAEKPEEAKAIAQRWALEATGKIAQISLDLDKGEDKRTVRGKKRARRASGT